MRSNIQKRVLYDVIDAIFQKAMHERKISQPLDLPKHQWKKASGDRGQVGSADPINSSKT